MNDLYAIEQRLHNEDVRLICGIDEAGRGPLAGPVCAAAVILPPGVRIEGLNDSKKLTEKKREALFDQICEQAAYYHVSLASEAEIEEHNILGATMLCMRRAVAELGVTPSMVLVDGNRIPEELPAPAESIVGGDGKAACIAAASILAKVTRDRLMVQLDELYPAYGFAKHKGYGTRQHIEALHQYGPCPVHRPSFLKKILGDGYDRAEA